MIKSTSFYDRPFSIHCSCTIKAAPTFSVNLMSGKYENISPFDCLRLGTSKRLQVVLWLLWCSVTQQQSVPSTWQIRWYFTQQVFPPLFILSTGMFDKTSRSTDTNVNAETTKVAHQVVIKGTPDIREEQPEHLEQLHNSRRGRNFSDKDFHARTDVEVELLWRLVGVMLKIKQQWAWARWAVMWPCVANAPFYVSTQIYRVLKNLFLFPKMLFWFLLLLLSWCMSTTCTKPNTYHINFSLVWH